MKEIRSEQNSPPNTPPTLDAMLDEELMSVGGTDPGGKVCVGTGRELPVVDEMLCSF